MYFLHFKRHGQHPSALIRLKKFEYIIFCNDYLYKIFNILMTLNYDLNNNSMEHCSFEKPKKIYVEEKLNDSINLNFLYCCKYENVLVIKDFINFYKNLVNINYIDQQGDNCFVVACENNSIEVIEFLMNTITIGIDITDVKIKEKAINKACQYNKNLDVIKYLFEVIRLIYEESIYYSSMNENDLIFDYVLEYTKYKICEKDVYHELNFLLFNKKTELFDIKISFFKKIIKKNNYNIHYTNGQKDTLLTQYLYGYRDINIVKILIFEFNFDLKHRDIYGSTSFLIACLYQCDFNIIKYFIEEIKVDITETNKNRKNCIDCAMSYRSNKLENLKVLKYLIEIVRIDISISKEYFKNKKIYKYNVYLTKTKNNSMSKKLQNLCNKFHHLK